MKVISLFDGMACGLTALKRIGARVTEYHAFEIDPHAITIAKKNHPEIIHHGSVVDADFSALRGADLLIGGSPCQGFSFAGKQLAFDDPRSKLFFEFIRARNEIMPLLILLENVKMKKEYLDVITQLMGVSPVFINSALVSAQNRQRFYWCNWKVKQPVDRRLFLKDIIEDDMVVDRKKSYCIDANYHKGGNLNQYLNKKRRQLVGVTVSENGIRPYKNDGRKGSFSEIGTIGVPDSKAGTITRSNVPKITGGRITGRKINPATGAREDYNADLPTIQRLEPGPDGKAGCLTTVQKDSILIEVGQAADKFGHDIQRRIYSNEGKAPSLMAIGIGGAIPPKIQNASAGEVFLENINYRKLTVTECERLQTLPDGYTEGVSNTNRYRMLGNGWTVDVIAHIFEQGGLDLI